MQQILALCVLFTVGCAALPQEPALPLASGEYVFQHRFAEHPSMPSIRLIATVRGDKITLVNPSVSNPFPAGVIEQGRLMWHPASGSWIIGESDADRKAPEVGGCSDGPSVVDLVAKIYWTC